MRVKLPAHIREMGKQQKGAQSSAFKKGGKKDFASADQVEAELQIWEEPNTTEADLMKLHTEGLLPSRELSEWRAPENHRVPALGKGEIVLFKPFVKRGFGLPSSDFFRGLLYFFGITLNHLNPHSILHLSIFVHLCEAFLGIPPSLTLFRYFFRLKPQPSTANPEVVGGAGIQFRAGKKGEFLSYVLPDSLKGWKTEWFYMGNLIPSLETHNLEAPKINTRWEEESLVENELEWIRLHVNQIKALKNRGLNGVTIVASFMRRQIQPLQQRQHYGFEYTGTTDPARVTTEELSDADLLERLQHVLAGVSALPAPHDEYDANNSPPQHLGRRFMDFPGLPPPRAGPSRAAEAVNLVSFAGADLGSDSEATPDDDFILRQRGDGEGTSGKRAWSLDLEEDTVAATPKRTCIAVCKVNESRLQGDQSAQETAKIGVTKEPQFGEATTAPLPQLPSSSLQLKAVPSQGDEDEGAALSNQLLRLPDIRVEDAVFVPAPSFKKMKVPSFKINISKRKQDPPRAPSPPRTATPRTPKEIPGIAGNTASAPSARGGGDGGGTASASAGELPLSSMKENPVPEAPETMFSQREQVVEVMVVARPDTQLGTTGHMLSTMAARPSLQSYSAELTRVKTAWSELVSKHSDFDTVLKELELKASEQAKHIHANFSAEVVRMKQQHAEQLDVAEARRTETVRALQSQIEKMEQEQERLRTERNLALAEMESVKDSAKKAEENFEAKGKALVQKHKDAESLAKQHEKRAAEWELAYRRADGKLQEAMKTTQTAVQKFNDIWSQLKEFREAIMPVQN